MLFAGMRKNQPVHYKPLVCMINKGRYLCMRDNHERKRGLVILVHKVTCNKKLPKKPFHSTQSIFWSKHKIIVSSIDLHDFKTMKHSGFYSVYNVYLLSEILCIPKSSLELALIEKKLLLNTLHYCVWKQRHHETTKLWHAAQTYMYWHRKLLLAFKTYQNFSLEKKKTYALCNVLIWSPQSRSNYLKQQKRQRWSARSCHNQALPFP